MKKTYIEPVLTMVTLGSMKMVATSLNPGDASPSADVSDEEWYDGFCTKEESVDDVWDD